MNKFLKIFIVMIALLIFVLPTAACGNDNKNEQGIVQEQHTEDEGFDEGQNEGQTQGHETRQSDISSSENDSKEVYVYEDGSYTSMEEVAAYIHEYEHLPDNYITKDEARQLGWDSSKGNLSKVAPGMSIGGDRFGNYEKRLPTANGRTYYECDIDYTGGKRNAKRIVYSNDGLVFFTQDHYNTFEQLY